MLKKAYFVLLFTVLLYSPYTYAQCIDTGSIASAAGTTQAGWAGDSELASLAKVNQPMGITGDAAGNLYIADASNHVIRKVDTDGIIHTIAGVVGASSFNYASGDANVVHLSTPSDVAVDANGDLYITERGSSLIRKLDVATNTISLIGGVSENGLGFSGDGGNATEAKFFVPDAIAVSSTGELFIADRFNHRIRKIAVDGIVTTVAGTFIPGYTGDGGDASLASLSNPLDIVLDAADNIYFVDAGNHVIRKIDHATGIISTIVGTGTPGFWGEGSLAANAQLNNPQGLAIDVAGNLYISDQGNARIRKISAADGTITTIMGTGTAGTPTAGDLAINANINPFRLYIDNDEKLYYSEWINHRILTVDCPERINEFFLEAECVAVGANWRVRNDFRASNGQFVVYPGIGLSLNSPPSDPDDIITFRVVADAGMYDLYARTLAFSSFNDAFWVRVEGGTWMSFSNIRKSLIYVWSQIFDGDINTPVSIQLNDGPNTIEFGIYEDGARLDKIAIVPAGSRPPEGFGGTAFTECGNVGSPDFDDDISSTEYEREKLNIYPNPFSAALHLEWTRDLPTDVTIRNTFGQVVWQKQGLLGMDEAIHLEQLPAGMYIVELENAEERKLSKIQKINP